MCFFQRVTCSKAIDAALIQSWWVLRILECLSSSSYNPWISLKQVYIYTMACQNSWCNLHSTYLNYFGVRPRKEEDFEANWASFSCWLIRKKFSSYCWFRKSMFPICCLIFSSFFCNCWTISSCFWFSWFISCSFIWSTAAKSSLDFLIYFSLSSRNKISYETKSKFSPAKTPMAADVWNAPCWTSMISDFQIT